MPKRVTIVMTDINQKKLRIIQGKLIQEGKSVSFSRVVNDVLSDALKNKKE